MTLLGDAHTNVEPDSSLGLRFYPLELYAFDDGLFVRSADVAHASIVALREAGEYPAEVCAVDGVLANTRTVPLATGPFSFTAIAGYARP